MDDCWAFLLDHVDEVFAFDVIGMAAIEQARRRQVWFAIKLRDALGNQVGMPLLLICVLQKLRFDRLRMDAGGHVVMELVAQYADQFGRQRLVEQIDHGRTIGAVAGGHRAVRKVPARALADVVDIADKRFDRGHERTPVQRNGTDGQPARVKAH